MADAHAPTVAIAVSRNRDVFAAPPFHSQDRRSVERPKRGHKRYISYGSFVPFFVIDSEYLKSLLVGKGGHCELSEPASESTPHAFPCEITRQYSSESDPSPANSEPTILYGGSVNGYYEPDFFSECEIQVSKLFVFMELHVSKLEDDLSHVVKRREMRENSKTSHEMDAEEEEDIGPSGKLKLLDSGIEGDHMQNEIGILRRLKEVVMHLLESLNSSFATLDELVQMHDDSYASSSGRDFLTGKTAKRNELDGRLRDCVTSVDSELARCDEYVKIDGLEKKIGESKVVEDVRKAPISCFTYVHFFLLLCVVILLSMMYHFGEPKWVVFLRLVRSPILTVVYFYLLGINMKVWAGVHIDYVSIFKFPSKGIPTPSYAFRVAGLFVMAFSALFVVLLIGGAYLDDVAGKVVTIFMWLLLIAFVINPVNVFLRPGRFAFIFVVVRILLAPLHFVYFGDFWFADQLNSTVAILLDVQYFLCYLSEDTWSKTDDPKVCTSSSNGIRPIVSCLPALWRFLQCLRCYYDTRQVKHLINAGKYSTTFPVIVFATLFSVRVPSTFSLTDLNLENVGWIVLCWVAFSILHTVYTYIWDIYCDWGLMQLGKRTLLRPHRLYRWTFVYYLAMFVDFVLRCAWVVKLTLAIVWHLDSDFLYTCLILGEILRRFIWNFFRVEWEQVCRMYPD